MKFNFTLKNCVLLVIVLLFSYMLLCQFFPTKEGMKEGADHEESNEEGEAEEEKNLGAAMITKNIREYVTSRYVMSSPCHDRYVMSHYYSCYYCYYHSQKNEKNRSFSLHAGL